VNVTSIILRYGAVKGEALARFVQVEWLLSGLFGVLTVAITIVGFFLRVELQDLGNSITRLNDTMVSLQTQSAASSASYEFLRKDIDDVKARTRELELRCAKKRATHE